MRCRGFATSRWSWSAAATRPSKKRPISRSSPRRSTWSIAATSCGPARSCRSGPSANPKIEMVWNHDARRSAGRRQRGRHRRAARQAPMATAARELPASGVFLAIGHTPNTAFLEGPSASSTTRATSSGRRRFARTPASKACSPPATWPTTTTGRRSPRPARGCMAALDAERWLAPRREFIDGYE